MSYCQSCADLQAEITRIRSDVEENRALHDLLTDYGKENAALKADVERLGEKCERWREIAQGTPPSVFPDDLAELVAENAALHTLLTDYAKENAALQASTRPSYAASPPARPPYQKVRQTRSKKMADCKIRDLDEALAVLEEIRSQTYTWERRWSNAAKFAAATLKARPIPARCPICHPRSV